MCFCQRTYSFHFHTPKAEASSVICINHNKWGMIETLLMIYDKYIHSAFFIFQSIIITLTAKNKNDFWNCLLILSLLKDCNICQSDLNSEICCPLNDPWVATLAVQPHSNHNDMQDVATEGGFYNQILLSRIISAHRDREKHWINKRHASSPDITCVCACLHNMWTFAARNRN